LAAVAYVVAIVATETIVATVAFFSVAIVTLLGLPLRL